MLKVYSIQWKILGQLCFSRQAQVTQNSWMIKNMYSVNSGNPLFFRASGSCSKIQNVKSIFHTAKNFWAALFIRASASCSNILNDKNTCSNTVKNIRANPFFRESASCSKILNDKKYIISTVNSGHPLFFRASACDVSFLPARWQNKACKIWEY